MGQKSEQINLEYMVQFEDGFRPRVHVYGIDSEAGEVYEVSAYIGVSVGAGHNVRAPSEEERKEKNTGAVVRMGSKIDTSLIINLFERKLPDTENWEQKMYEDLREGGWNVIKIQNPEHIKPAIHRHEELYVRQFFDLAERFVNLFQGFIGEHPGYGKY